VKKQLTTGLCLLTGGFCIYVAVFGFMWAGSPSQVSTSNGKIYRYTEWQYNTIKWKTRFIWAPALWTMENVFGYQIVAEIAAGPKTVTTFAKVVGESTNSAQQTGKDP
jgi:hypothetical protein